MIVATWDENMLIAVSEVESEISLLEKVAVNIFVKRCFLLGCDYTEKTINDYGKMFLSVNDFVVIARLSFCDNDSITSYFDGLIDSIRYRIYNGR